MTCRRLPRAGTATRQTSSWATRHKAEPAIGRARRPVPKDDAMPGRGRTCQTRAPTSSTLAEPPHPRNARPERQRTNRNARLRAHHARRRLRTNPQPRQPGRAQNQRRGRSRLPRSGNHLSAAARHHHQRPDRHHRDGLGDELPDTRRHRRTAPGRARRRLAAHVRGQHPYTPDQHRNIQMHHRNGGSTRQRTARQNGA